MKILSSCRVVGIEVKASTQVQANDFKGLRHLRDLIGPQFHRGIVIHPGERSMRFDQQLASVPVGVLWAQDTSAETNLS